jgi:hypothetical protein
MNAQYIEDLSVSLMQMLLGTNESIRKITNEFDRDTHLPFGSGVTLSYYLIVQKIIIIDMLDSINLEQPISIRSVDESKVKKVKYG